MKKFLFLLSATLFTGSIWAQTPTIVSTTPQNRNAIIEELTGINCQWCPAGHKVVNEIIEANEGRVVGINVHAGVFSQNSPYNTTFGTAYDNQANPDGYPAGTVNRHIFSGSSMSLGRGSFEQASDMIMNMASPVNVAAIGRFDDATRQVQLHIEVYYTDNSTVGTNYLNVAVLQNNVLGQQSGGQANYPEMMENGQYRHMHMLRTMLTGTWGTPITATQGSFFDTTIVYDVPQSIGQVAIPTLSDLDFVVFVAEGHAEILTGVKATMISDKPSLGAFKVLHDDCSLTYQPYITIINNTESDLNNFTFNYDGTTYICNKTIASLATDTVNLPSVTFSVNNEAVQNCLTTKSVSLVSCLNANGDVVSVNSDTKTVTFADFNIYTVTSPLKVKIGIDAYGSEASLALVNQANCQTIWATGSWSDLSVNWNSIQYISQIPDARYYTYEFAPETPGLYLLRALDGYGDGWTSTNDNVTSGVWLSNANGEIFADPMGYSRDIAFVSRDYYLNITNSGDGSVVGIEDVNPVVDFSIYPNPVSEVLTINGVEGLREVSVLDVTGRQVMTSTTGTVDVSALSAGVYMLRVACEQGVGVQKFVKE